MASRTRSEITLGTKLYPKIKINPDKPALEARVRNHKIGNDTIILNITSAHDCRSWKNGLCQIPSLKSCYAYRDEVQYKDTLPFRRRQNIAWDALTADEIAAALLVLADWVGGIEYIRFQESGDFRRQDDVTKMSRISDLLRGNIRAYTYTARKDLDYRNHSSNLVINGSGFMVDNEFRVIPEEDINLNGVICDCTTQGKSADSCINCLDKCKIKRGAIIQEALRHGTAKKIDANPAKMESAGHSGYVAILGETKATKPKSSASYSISSDVNKKIGRKKGPNTGMSSAR